MPVTNWLSFHSTFTLLLRHANLSSNIKSDISHLHFECDPEDTKDRYTPYSFADSVSQRINIVRAPMQKNLGTVKI